MCHQNFGVRGHGADSRSCTGSSRWGRQGAHEAVINAAKGSRTGASTRTRRGRHLRALTGSQGQSLMGLSDQGAAVLLPSPEACHADRCAGSREFSCRGSDCWAPLSTAVSLPKEGSRHHRVRARDRSDRRRGFSCECVPVTRELCELNLVDEKSSTESTKVASTNVLKIWSVRVTFHLLI